MTRNALLAASMSPDPWGVGDAADLAYFGTRAVTEPEYRSGLLDRIRPNWAALRNLPVMLAADAMVSDQPMGPALSTINAMGLNEPQMDLVSALTAGGAPLAAVRRADDVADAARLQRLERKKAELLDRMNRVSPEMRPALAEAVADVSADIRHENRVLELTAKRDELMGQLNRLPAERRPELAEAIADINADIRDLLDL